MRDSHLIRLSGEVRVITTALTLGVIFMSSNTVRRLAGHILLNSQARQAMLSGNRESILRQFDLTRQEQQALSQMRVDSASGLLAILESLAQSSIAADESPSAMDDRIGVRSQQLIFR